MEGNKLFSTEEAVYGKITAVKIGSHVWPFKRILLTDALPALNIDEPQYDVENISFELGDLPLRPEIFRTATEELPKFPLRAAAIAEATKKVCYPSQPFCAFASREAQEDSGDSDDDAPQGQKVVSPFTPEETVHINMLLQKYWHRFTHAQDKLFENAVGKFFLQSYFELCACVPGRMERDIQVFHSTNPNGENQPGFARVGWCVPPRQLQDTSSEPQPNWGNRVADVVMYDPVPQMYTVVAEIKSAEDAEKGGGLEQNIEQMLGLFMDRHTLILGLVVQYLRVRPLLLRLADGDLTLTKLQVLSLQPEDITKLFTMLMKVLIGIN